MSPWPITIMLPHGLAVGGVTTWAVQLAGALAEKGREVRVVVHEDGSNYAQLPAARIAPAVRLVHAAGLTTATGRQEALRAYRRLLPTVLLPNLLAEGYAVAASLALTLPEEVRVVAWNHSDNAYDYTYLAYYEPIVQQFVPVSRRCTEELACRMPARIDAIHHVPYGVHVPPPQDREALGERPIRLVYAGRMEQAGKRVLGYVDLARALDARGVRFELRLVGDGPQAGELRRRIAALAGTLRHAENRVWLEPAVSHERIASVWQWADAALLNSTREGFSISMVESMAAGCVPIVSRVASGVDDIVIDGQTGLTFPVDDIDALADCVARLARGEADWRKMSDAACGAARRHCDYDQFLGRVMHILDEAQAGPPRAWPIDRPLVMNATTSGCGGLPTDAAGRLERLLESLAQRGEEPVAIFGAGRHTRALADVWARSPVRIAGVIDDGYEQNGSRLWGWPIVTPEAAAALGPRAVVISSRMHEAEIYERHQARFSAAGMTLYRLYGDMPAERTGAVEDAAKA